jgi:uncharacterized membrane protein required for colicin V production
MFTSQLAEFFTHSETVQNAMTQSTSAMGMDTAKPLSYMAIGVSFAILFIVTVIIGSVIKALLNLIFTIGILGFGNRIMGGLFGAVRAYLICLAGIFFIQLSPLSKQPWWVESKYIPYFQPQLVWLGNQVSPVLSDLKSTFDTQVQEIQDTGNRGSEKISNKPPEKISATAPVIIKKPADQPEKTKQ